jgi:hypothetical protein
MLMTSRYTSAADRKSGWAAGGRHSKSLGRRSSDGCRRQDLDVLAGANGLNRARTSRATASATAIAEAAPALLGNYVSPFTGARGADNPLVFAGFVISNSETGHGSFKITPQITVQICDNGLTLTLWVPRTRSRHATRMYSCTRPPSRSRRRGWIVAPEGGGVGPAGGC